MKIIKISQELPQDTTDETRKQQIIDFYIKNINKNPSFHKTTLQLMKGFQDDWEISVLYDNLYAKVKNWIVQLEKNLEIIKLETDRPKKTKDLLKFYQLAYPNATPEERTQVFLDIGIMTIEEINNYINNYVTNWKNI